MAKEHRVVSVEGVLKKLNWSNDPLLVVAGPYGSGVTTAILQAYQPAVFAIHHDHVDWAAILRAKPPMILVNGADAVPEFLLRLILDGAPDVQIILRTGPEIPARLAHLPATRLL